MANAPGNFVIFSGTLSATAAQLGQGIVNHGRGGMVLNAHISAVNSPGTLDLQVMARDSYGNSYSIPGAALPTITATGDFQLYVGQNIPVIPGQSVCLYLPLTIFIAATLGGGGSFDTQISATMVD